MNPLMTVVAGLLMFGGPATDTNTLDITVEDSTMVVTVSMENSRELADASPDWFPLHIIQTVENEDSPAIEYSDNEWRSLADQIAAAGIDVAGWGERTPEDAAIYGDDLVVGVLPLDDGRDLYQIAVRAHPDSWGADLDTVRALDAGIAVYDERYVDWERANDPDCVGARDFAMSAAPYADRADVSVVAEPDRCVVNMTHRFPVSSPEDRALAENFVEMVTGGVVKVDGDPDIEMTVDVRPTAAVVLGPDGSTMPGGTSGFIDTVTITDADGTPVEALIAPTDPTEPAVMSGPVVASRLEHPTTTAPRSPASIPGVAPVPVPSSSPLIPVVAAALVLIAAFAVWRAARRRTT